MARQTKSNAKTTTSRTRRPRRTSTIRGLKGGVSSVQKEAQKEIPQMFQQYADKTLKVAHKMGLKGGAAVLAGGAAGVVVGAALGSLAGAAMTGMRSAKMTQDTRNAAESISRHAEDLKKFTGKKS